MSSIADNFLRTSTLSSIVSINRRTGTSTTHQSTSLDIKEILPSEGKMSCSGWLVSQITGLCCAVLRVVSYFLEGSRLSFEASYASVLSL